MITMTFEQPRLLKDHFRVVTDATPWNRTYVKTPHGITPLRERATFQKINQVLLPKSPTAHRLDKATGLYMLAFDLPTPSLYVGIAAEAQSPEGILRRLRKHCIKAMGSNVGNPGSTGGVHHPRKWTDFAIQRHAFLNGVQDPLGDVRIATAQVSSGNTKADLQNFESLICSNSDQILDRICDELWVGTSSSNVRLLTSATVHLRGIFEHRLLLW
jgi:hypothetical protein